MDDDNSISIDPRTQEILRGIRSDAAQLQEVMKMIVSAIYFQSGKKGNYKSNKDFTKLELVEVKKDKGN